MEPKRRAASKARTRGNVTKTGAGDMKIRPMLVAALLALASWALTMRTALTQEQHAVLESDAAEYAPGETATLTGRGFQSLEPIQLGISIEQPVTGTHVGTAALDPFEADADGNF